MGYIFSSTTISGATADFTYFPTDDTYIAPVRNQRNFNNVPTTTSSKPTREFLWKTIPVASWVTLYNLCGGDSAVSAAGYVVCPDFGATGSSDTWGYYSCDFEMPDKMGFFFRTHRLNVVIRALNMTRLSDAP